ncbi:MAG TPA: MarC family protein [Chthoniobacterales bacterium]
MPAWIEPFLLVFIPLFVALDPVGLIPVFLSMAGSVPEKDRKRVIFQATVTAALVAVGFVFLGKFIFHALGIGVADFKIAGGLILLVLAVQDILAPQPHQPKDHPDFGVVPLGMPLIAGPAMLTALLTLSDTVGVPMTLAGLLVNLVLVYAALRFGEPLKRLLGATTMRAVSKMVALLLAAIAVHMIRSGWND